MNINKGDYVLGYWFAEDKDGNDWLMTVVKRDGKWLGEYRFRYKKDDKVFGSEDKKSFYSVSMGGEVPEDEVIRNTNLVFAVIKEKFNQYSKFTPVKGDLDKFTFLLAQEPFSHVKRINTNGKTDEEIKKEVKEIANGSRNSRRTKSRLSR